jgi:hypothetical protein
MKPHQLSKVAVVLTAAFLLAFPSSLPVLAQLSFAPAVTYGSGGYYATSVAVANVNRDGIPDMVVTNCNSLNNGGCNSAAVGAVGVLLGDGDGTFQTAVAYSSGGYVFATSVAVADVNGDGKPDLLVTNACFLSSNEGGCDNGSVVVLLGNGDGTFKEPVRYNSGGGQASSVAVADVNGDGKPDLVVANTCARSGVDGCNNGSVGILLGNGDGTFQTAVPYSSGGYYAVSVALADVDGDGKSDIVVMNQCTTGGATGCTNTVGLVGYCWATVTVLSSRW